MKITRNKLLSGILLFGLTSMFLVLLDIQFLYLRAIFSFIFLTTVPGLLIMLALRIRGIGFWEYLVYTVGLSIAFLMFGGLAVNWILPWLHITDKPLSLAPLVISFSFMLFVLGILAYIRNKDLSLEIKIPKLNIVSKIFFITPIIFPILSILGAITLNNGGPNYLTMIMLGGIAAYVFLLVIFRNKLNENIYPYAIFMISLSLLLMLSLRSWYISGFDISKEFQVFQITKEKMLWSMLNFNNIYNACLSINILPTVLSTFLHIRDEYIYKLIFQILFAIVPLGTYILFRKLRIKRELAFLAGIFYISNPWFIDPLTTINRQEIAFIFFIMILLIIFEEKLSSSVKSILLILFSLSMVVSHYSTTYIAILIFLLSYILLKFFMLNKGFIANKFRFSESLIVNTNKVSISGIYLLFLILLTFIWYFQITKSSNNIIYVAQNTTRNIENILNKDMKNEIINQIFNLGSNDMDTDVYNKYYSIQSAEYKRNKYLSLYNPSSYKDFKLIPKAYSSLKIKNKELFLISNSIYKTTLILIELFLIVGTVYILFRNRSKYGEIQRLFVSLSLSGQILLVTMVILPYVSIAYNFDRLYMQVMIVLSLIEVIGGIVFFDLIFKKYKLSVCILTTFLVLNFLFTYGIIWQITGGKTVSWMNNFGYSYVLTYTHKSETFSAKWLGRTSGNSLIYTTIPGRNMIWAYGYKDNIITDIIPAAIDKFAYVYTTNASLNEKMAIFSYKSQYFGYDYPFNFLNINKNQIYNNGQSVIYK